MLNSFQHLNTFKIPEPLKQVQGDSEEKPRLLPKHLRCLGSNDKVRCHCDSLLLNYKKAQFFKIKCLILLVENFQKLEKYAFCNSLARSGSDEAIYCIISSLILYNEETLNLFQGLFPKILKQVEHT